MIGSLTGPGEAAKVAACSQGRDLDLQPLLSGTMMEEHPPWLFSMINIRCFHTLNGNRLPLTG